MGEMLIVVIIKGFFRIIWATLLQLSKIRIKNLLISLGILVILEPISSWQYSPGWMWRYHFILTIGILLIVIILIVKGLYSAYLLMETRHQRWAQNIREPEAEKQRRQKQQQIRKPTTED